MLCAARRKRLQPSGRHARTAPLARRAGCCRRPTAHAGQQRACRRWRCERSETGTRSAARASRVGCGRRKGPRRAARVRAATGLLRVRDPWETSAHGAAHASRHAFPAAVGRGPLGDPRPAQTLDGWPMWVLPQTLHSRSETRRRATVARHASGRASERHSHRTTGAHTPHDGYGCRAPTGAEQNETACRCLAAVPRPATRGVESNPRGLPRFSGRSLQTSCIISG